MMTYIFIAKIAGKSVVSQPLSYDELLQTIQAYIAKDVHDFEVISCRSQRSN